MRRLDSPRASLYRDAPVEPLGDGRTTLFGEPCEPPIEEDSGNVPGSFFGSIPNPLSKSCKFRLGVQPTSLRFQSLTLEEIGTGLVNTRGVDYHRLRPGVYAATVERLQG